MMPFGETVLVWRLARGMTQDALARAARVSRPNLSAIERGDRDVTLRTLRALAFALGVRPGVLVDGDAPPMDSARTRLGREELERVAAAAARPAQEPARAPVPAAARLSSSERRLASQLATVTAGRRGGARPRTGRRADRAYLLLRAQEAPETIASLVDRIRSSPPHLPPPPAGGDGE